MRALRSPIPVPRSFVAGSSNAGGGFSPRSSSTRRLVDASPASLRPHSHPVASAAFQARRNVIVPRLAGLGRLPVAAGVCEEVQLSVRPSIHGSHHGATNVGPVPQVVGEIRNV